MAEAWTWHLKSDAVEAWSAGVEVGTIDPRAIMAMAEAGVDISGQYAKHVDEVMDIPFDYVVTLCGHAYETCPVFPVRTKKVHRGFDDPPKLAAGVKDEEQALQIYRRVRDEIKDFVESLPASLEL